MLLRALCSPSVLLLVAAATPCTTNVSTVDWRGSTCCVSKGRGRALGRKKLFRKNQWVLVLRAAVPTRYLTNRQHASTRHEHEDGKEHARPVRTEAHDRRLGGRGLREFVAMPKSDVEPKKKARPRKPRTGTRPCLYSNPTFIGTPSTLEHLAQYILAPPTPLSKWRPKRQPMRPAPDAGRCWCRTPRLQE